jgi:hypothetical protein
MIPIHDSLLTLILSAEHPVRASPTLAPPTRFHLVAGRRAGSTPTTVGENDETRRNHSSHPVGPEVGPQGRCRKIISSHAASDSPIPTECCAPMGAHLQW